MSKPRGKSQSKPRKRSPCTKTVKEQKSLFHFCWEFFLLLLSRLWKPGRKLFGESFGLSGKKKEPSLSLERPDDTSSAALAAFCGASGAAKRASEEQTEEPASEMFSPSTVTDKDPRDDPKSTGHSTEALTLDPEVVGAVFSSEHNGVMVGGHFCPYQAGYRHSYEEHAKLHLLERLHVDAASSSSGLPQPKPSYASIVASDKRASNSNKALLENIERVISSTRHTVGGIVQMDEVGHKKTGKPQLDLFERLSVNEDYEIKSERPGSDSGYWEEECTTDKKIFALNVELRQDLARYEKTPAGQKRDASLQIEVLKLEEGISETFYMIFKPEVMSEKVYMTSKPEAMSEKVHMIFEPEAMSEKLLMIFELEAMSENVHMFFKPSAYTNTLRTMQFQNYNMYQEVNFWSSDWRKANRFPVFRNHDPEYEWWQQNFDREILEKRLKILRVASDNHNPHLNMYRNITLVSKFNAELHPPPRENEDNETLEDKMCTHATVICSLLSSGDTEI